MKTLTTAELQEILPWLKSQFPRSLPVYHMAQNNLRNHYPYHFFWPGMEFLVDRFPQPTVCICRPHSSTIKQSYVSMLNGQHIFLYAANPTAFQCIWLKNYSDLVHLEESVTFTDIDADLANVLLDTSERFTHVPGTEGFPNGERCFHFDLTTWNTELARIQLPSHVRLGELHTGYVDQIVANCANAYGQPQNRRAFIEYLLTHHFPSAAIFDAKRSTPNTPIAYCMYWPQGVVGHVYINHDYRQQGLFKVLLAHLLGRLWCTRVVSVWMETMNLDIPNQIEDLRNLGGREFKHHNKCWVAYSPNTPANPKLQEKGRSDFKTDAGHEKSRKAGGSSEGRRGRNSVSVDAKREKPVPRGSGRRESLQREYEREGDPSVDC
ncbi:uncharacterized protein LOC129592669 [Paramacrobiotus metropolitanus]|uniref:uncharacterized protein LOC129592669 n=1 Tax=Paramacrobiotus metropolitanus TaxID=2943436 RepID=UPI002445F81D|nr:uncharacterized protein LOC129592669 [Paramacrobiotus metropolitanus]